VSDLLARAAQVAEENRMGKLTAATRKKLPRSDFALPGRRFPVEDKAHARDAKARASQSYNAGRLSAADKDKVDRKADAVLAKKGGRS
jgi:hypothetical protein